MGAIMQAITRRAAISSMAAAIMGLCISSQRAYARASGQSVTVLVDEYSYTGQAKVGDGGVNWGYCTTICSSEGPNSIANVARLYNYNGALVSSDETIGQRYVPLTVEGSVSGEFYGNGIMRVYRPSQGSWQSVGIPSTPHGYGRAALQEDIMTNQAGELCGPAPLAQDMGIQLDLILAIGVSGVEGYIRASDDWIPLPSSEEEIVEWMSTRRVKTIPVYAVDGITVIDSFNLYYGASK